MKKECPKIMIIENDYDIRTIIQEFLEAEGYGVESFSNGKDALERIRELPEPCLVLLDLMMPVMNGYRFLEEFKKHPATIVPIPVYIFSAHATEEETKHLGCNGFIKKPVDLNILTLIIERYCETIVHWDQNAGKNKASRRAISKKGSSASPEA